MNCDQPERKNWFYGITVQVDGEIKQIINSDLGNFVWNMALTQSISLYDNK